MKQLELNYKDAQLLLEGLDAIIFNSVNQGIASSILHLISSEELDENKLKETTKEIRKGYELNPSKKDDISILKAKIVLIKSELIKKQNKGDI
jgi:hypothetical protein